MEKFANNKVIASYMGVRIVKKKPMAWFRDFELFTLEELNYNGSWDWLIPVLTKMSHDPDIDNFDKVNLRTITWEGIQEDNIEKVWRIVVEILTQ